MKKKPTKKKKEQPVSSKLTLVDNCPRSPLIEGRNYGIAFALCKRDGDTCTTVGPQSPCKDYMNDQVYAEWTGKPYAAWGYKAKKEGIFEGQKFAHVAFSILPYKSGGKYATQDKETEFASNNYAAMASFINQIEKLLKLEDSTTIEKVGQNQFIAIIPLFWVQYTYLISLWSLLARIALESAFLEGNPMEYLEKCKTGDSMMVVTALPKLKKMIDGIMPKQDFTKPTGWHDEGIVSFEFPS